jgi:hypothetical protein
MINETSEQDLMMLHCLQALEKPYRAKCYENRSEQNHRPVACAFARQTNENHNGHCGGQNHARSHFSIALHLTRPKISDRWRGRVWLQVKCGSH